jgi:hypothetical protein
MVRSVLVKARLAPQIVLVLLLLIDWARIFEDE